MKNIKRLLGLLAVVFSLTVFSNNAFAQEVKIYQSAVDQTKIKVELGYDNTIKLFVKQTPTSEWSARNVTYHDEELIKYTKVSDGKTLTWTLVFAADLSSFVLNKPDGKKDSYNLIR